MLIFISLPQPFLREIDGLLWKEQDTPLHALQGHLSLNSSILPLTAYWMTKFFPQSHMALTLRKASMDVKHFPERQY